MFMGDVYGDVAIWYGLNGHACAEVVGDWGEEMTKEVSWCGAVFAKLHIFDGGTRVMVQTGELRRFKGISITSNSRSSELRGGNVEQVQIYRLWRSHFREILERRKKNKKIQCKNANVRSSLPARLDHNHTTHLVGILCPILVNRYLISNCNPLSSHTSHSQNSNIISHHHSHHFNIVKTLRPLPITHSHICAHIPSTTPNTLHPV